MEAFYTTKSFRQVFLNLLGRDNVDKPTRLSGIALNQDEKERFSDNPFIGSMFVAHHGMLLTYFGDFQQYSDLLLQMGHDHLQKVHVASPNNLWETYLKGISCFATAQETGKRKYADLGQVFRSKIKSWLDMGNPNVKHYGSLLDAEYMAFKSKLLVLLLLLVRMLVQLSSSINWPSCWRPEVDTNRMPRLPRNDSERFICGSWATERIVNFKLANPSSIGRNGVQWPKLDN
jgi:hypothetical protein